MFEVQVTTTERGVYRLGVYDTKAEAHRAAADFVTARKDGAVAATIWDMKGIVATCRAVGSGTAIAWG